MVNIARRIMNSLIYSLAQILAYQQALRAKLLAKAQDHNGKIFAKPWPLALLYLATSTILQWSYGLSANIVQINAAPLAQLYHADAVQMAWLVGAYMAPNVSLAIILVKLRMQFGLYIFAQLSIVLFLFASLLNSFVTDWESVVVIRFFSGIVASPISSLGFLYMMEAFPIEKKFTTALSLNLMNVSMAGPLAHIISPLLVERLGINGPYLLEITLTCLCFISIFCLPLTPVPKQKMIESHDIWSYSLIAIGLGINAILLTVGMHYGWRENWIIIGFIIAALSLILAGMLEWRRKNPLINLRWLFSRDMLHIAFILLMFRLILSEQASIAANFSRLFGFDGADLIKVYSCIALGVALGGLACAFFYRPGREDGFHIIALILLSLGAYMDKDLALATQSYNLHISQALIGCGGAMFMPPSMARGLAKALIGGPKYVISFVAVFLVTQNTGGLLGVSVFTTTERFYQQSFYEKLIREDSWNSPHLSFELAQEAGKLTNHASDPILRTIKAQEVLRAKYNLLADIMAYNQVFEWYFYIAIFVLSFLLMKLLYQYVKYRQLKTAKARARLRQAKNNPFFFS